MTTLTSKLKSRQIPGRLESLGAVIAGNANEAQKLAAGIHHRFKAMSASIPASTFTMSSGVEQMTEQERSALPF